MTTVEAHAARTDRIFEKLWLPGGWRGRFGHYQSQLKAIMAMIGQPGGTVRRPRLPVTDPDLLRELRQILVEEQILVLGGGRHPWDGRVNRVAVTSRCSRAAPP